MLSLAKIELFQAYKWDESVLISARSKITAKSRDETHPDVYHVNFSGERWKPENQKALSRLLTLFTIYRCSGNQGN